MGDKAWQGRIQSEQGHGQLSTPEMAKQAFPSILMFPLSPDAKHRT